jgi:exodeoxyribonuclease V gamma subunit
VVALMGLDDGEFPRHPEPDGDDLLSADPVVGDRDARSEDRQLLLDALLAATDHLLITYCGRDERTNRERPPCAPVAELLDVVDATVSGGDGAAARTALVVQHPLQPFDPRNFRAGELGRSDSWSFDAVFLDGARAALSPPLPARPDDGPLAYVPDPVLALEDLVSFVQHPARSFLRTRLSLRLGDWTEELDGRLPLELGPLDRWGVGDRLLEAVLSGVSMEAAVEVERRRGLLPPGSLADQILDSVRPGVVGLVAALERDGFAPGPTGAVHVDIALPDGRRLFGAVPQVRDGTALQCVYSKLGPKHRLAAWVRFLALTADRPGDDPAALTVGRGDRAGLVASSYLAAGGASGSDPGLWALDRLVELVDLYDRGMTGPLPMACGTSARWAEGRRDRLDDEGLLSGAGGKWLPSGDIPGERDDPEHVFVYGRFSDVRVLLEERPRPDEAGPGWAADEPSRFGRVARRLWEPLLEHEARARQ